MDAETIYEQIRLDLRDYEDVESCTMMGRPALATRGIRFLFVASSGFLVLKLGASPPDGVERRLIEPFTPHRTRRPMRGWFSYRGVDVDAARRLARAARQAAS